jgi:hypothetical protein
MTQDVTTVEGLIVAVVLLGLSTGMSALDALVKDAGPDSPRWLRILSRVKSAIAFNVGKASNDPESQ